MDYSADIREYIDGVLSGEIVSSRPVRLAVKRHVDDLENAGRRGYVFDEKTANDSIAFIEQCCVHTRNSIGARAGAPLLLSPSQKFIKWCLMGWKRKSDGLRRFKRGHVEVARKWGKSTFASAVALHMLTFDSPLEMTAEVYAAATKENQARIVFDEARRMVRRSPAFQSRTKVLQKSILFPETDGFFQPIGSDSTTTDGLNPSCTIMDELHAWQKRHRGLHEKLTSAGGARLQPLWLVITTAGDDNSEIWQEEREYALRCVESVMTGHVIDDTLFAFIACIDAEQYTCIECMGKGCDWCDDGVVDADDPFDETTWIKAQPNLGYSVDIEWFHEGANEAKNKPTALNKFLRYYCNVKVTSSARAIDPVLWAGCNAPVEVEPGAYCCGGFDLGRSDDFAAWSLVFPESDGEDTRYEVLSKSYTCEDRKSGISESLVNQWESLGQLEVHPGDQVDFNAVEADIVSQSAIYQVRSWAFDPQFAMQMGQNLLNTHGIECFKFSQSYGHYNEAVRELLRLVRAGRLSHGGDSLLAWQANNLIIKKDHRDLWMPDKVGSDDKIDAMVSLLMGLSECMFHEKQPKAGEFYETNKLEIG